jgi:hypothetical protein
MATSDYIRCNVCDTKVIYDGHWTTRDSWGDNWPTVICAECAKAMQPKLNELILDRIEKAAEEHQ